MSEQVAEQAPIVLTDKQRAFVEAYLACWNATDSALQAGYSKKTAYSIGSENLKKPEIKKYIEARFREKHLTADEVLARLADMARGSMEDFVTPSGRGFRIDISKARKAGKMHLLKTVSKGPRGARVELYDAQAALVQLGRALRLFQEEPAINVNVNITSDDLAKARDRAQALEAELVTEPEPEAESNG